MAAAQFFFVMRILLFFSLFLFSKLTFAQYYFTDTTTHGTVASLYAGMVVEDDSTFYMLGLFPEINSNLNVRILVTKRRNQLLVNQWIRGVPDKYYYMGDIKKYGDSLFIIGSIHGVSPFPTQPIYNTYFLILNTNGDSLMYKEFDSGLPDVTISGQGIVKMGNEIWLAVSRRKVSSNTVLDRKVCLIRLDSIGNEKARYVYGNTTLNYSQNVRGIDVNDDNEIIVSAGDCQGCLRNGIAMNQAWIFAVDTSGQIIRQYFSNPSKNLGLPFKTSKTLDGGWVFSTLNIYTYPRPNGFNTYRSQGYVSKLNAQFQLEWDSIYGRETSTTVLVRTVPDNTGGYIAVGAHIDSSHSTLGWMTKFNGHGEMQWQRFFMPFPSLQEIQIGHLQYVAVTDQGNIVAAGRGENFNSSLDHAQYAWLIKTDSMGCLVPGCAVSLRELTTEPVYLKAWPNPVSEVLNVLVKSEKPLYGAQFKLTDMIGRIQRQWEGGYEELQYQIGVQDLSAGMYFLQLIKDGQLLASEKIIKQ